jgi:hypothetical protein
MIPNGDVITVQVKRNSPTPEVHFAVMEKTRVQQENYRYFAIFEIVEHNFGKTYWILEIIKFCIMLNK